jgi:acyl-CoA reductase-like NAD-dependent aldehyde dehydrogenase
MNRASVDIEPLYLAGDFTRSDAHQIVRAPWDDRPLGAVSLAQGSHVERAIDCAHGGVPSLRASATHARRAWLTAIADALRAERSSLAELIADEAGKPLPLALAEVTRAEGTFRLAADECARLGGEVLALDMSPATDGVIGAWTRVASGALLAITPFNFPLNLVAHKLAPAFALGMPVVLKPAPQTPRTALALARIVQGSGAPGPLLSVLPAPVELAARMVEDSRFSALSFTGSASVGWALKSRAGRKRTLLELGGTATTLIAPDADPLRAIDKITQGAFAYAGQVCIKTQRVFVPRARWDAAREALCAAAQGVTVRDPRDPSGLCGPLIDEASAVRVRRWIDEAVARGAELACGGDRTRNQVSPAVVIDAPEGCALHDEEIFGPVLTLHGYDTLDEAIARVERGRYGLQCALFSEHLPTIREVFARLTVGALIVNDSTTLRVDSMPYGGVKDSGLGREGVRFAIDELSDKKLLVLR